MISVNLVKFGQWEANNEIDKFSDWLYNFSFTEMLFLSLMLIQNEIKLKFIFISAFPSSLLQDDT